MQRFDACVFDNEIQALESDDITMTHLMNCVFKAMKITNTDCTQDALELLVEEKILRNFGKVGHIEDIVVHDETNKVLAQLLANLKLPDFPEPIGVLYCDPSAPDFTGEVYDQRAVVRENKEEPDLNALLRTGHTWTVE